ncbi:tetratricopeptide repeat protein [Tenacibaculum piscium]|uniref:tetratricopeptide repeat protein n=1 Tax=Tenacibaculum piscium TaxID=1458515 RepID=UPI001F41CDEA|nr:tetratricopeptide repeat protein [Tenacibaculum piscium]
MMKQFSVLLLFLITNILLAQTAEELFINANNSYKKGNYTEAVKLYQDIEKTQNVSADVYFNLANAYYKLHKVAPAIYNYEKALQLNPLHQDAQNNLSIAKKLTLDRIEKLPSSLSQKINENFLQKFNYNTWAFFTIIFSFLMAMLFLGYYFSGNPTKKKLFFTSSIISFLLLISCLLITYQQYNQTKNMLEAIIFSEKIDVKNAPTQDAEQLFILHEGTKVQILDTVDSWNKIKLADGKTGWVVAKKIKQL